MLKIIRDNPKAFLLAVVVHVMMIVALSFSIDWTSRHKTAASDVKVIQAVMIDESKIKAEAERMRKLEQEKRRKLEADKRRKAEQEKKRKEADANKRREAEKRKQAELKKKQQADKKRKAEAEAKRKKADAEAKRKKEARKKQEAEKKRKEAEKKRKQEAERKRKAEEERKRQEEEARLRAEEDLIRQEQMAAEQAAMESARQQALVGERDKYIGLIKRRVESKWVRPSGWRSGITCMVEVTLVPGAGGTAQVINASMVKSCGSPLFDRSVENAVFSASPLPFPTSLELMNEFRRFNLNFDPKE